MSTLRKIVTMRAYLESPTYLGTDDQFGGPSWRPWRVVLIAALGEALTDDERITLCELTGREREPGKPVSELVAAVGRRGGKSRAIGALGVYMAVCVDHRHILAKGQIGLVPIVSASKGQAVEIRNYALGIIESVPAFAKLLKGEATAEAIELSTRITLKITAASFKRVRGATAVAFVADEVAFWTNDVGANPDAEIIGAARPMLATTSGMLVMISSTYARRGVFYKTVIRHHGPDGNPEVLVVKAASRDMNPSLPQAVVDRAYDEDPAAAAAEYGSEWRSDVDGFVSDEVISPLLLKGVHEIAPESGVHYVAFVDAASGSGKDSMTLAIAWADGKIATLALIDERRPRFDPEAVVASFADTLRRYGMSRVKGDRWAAGFVESAFKRNGIIYETSEKTKSDLYLEVAPMLNAAQCRLLDNRRLHAQLIGLERRTSRTGRDTVDHAPGGHDDVANAACGALVNAQTRRSMIVSDAFVDRCRAWRSSGNPSDVARC